jgi:hypothetical protein
VSFKKNQPFHANQQRFGKEPSWQFSCLKREPKEEEQGGRRGGGGRSKRDKVPRLNIVWALERQIYRLDPIIWTDELRAREDISPRRYQRMQTDRQTDRELENCYVETRE